MKALRRVSAVLIGFVFFLAGLLKLMDPVGAGLIVDEYFKFFHLRFLSFSSGFVAEAAALAETLTGAALLTGVWRRITGVVAGLLLGFFTLLTLILVIFNPAMDCGCFGEAIHLTHFQSLVKNLVLCALWCLAFIPLKAQEMPRRTKYVAFGIAALSVTAFAVFSLKSVPAMDFTPYAPGEELHNSAAPEQGGSPMLTFSNAEGEYCDAIAASGQVALVSVYNPGRMNAKKWSRAARTMSDAAAAGYKPLLLVAASPSSFDGPEAGVTPYFADRRELLTLNRSNGGLTLVSDAQIVAKWSSAGRPDFARFAIDDAADATELMMERESSLRMKVQGFLLYVSAVMLLL